MLPKIKKKIKSFLMDETGSISKTNLIKGALFLTVAGTTMKKVKGNACYTNCMNDPALNRGNPNYCANLCGSGNTGGTGVTGSGTGSTGSGSGATGSPVCGDTKIGSDCSVHWDGDGGSQPESQTLEGGSQATWICEQFTETAPHAPTGGFITDCRWRCEAPANSKGSGTCCSKSRHTNSGKAIIKTDNSRYHYNYLSGRYSSPGLSADHGQHNSHASYSEMAQCEEYQAHANHCQHGSHTSW
jgi:hypothetical protein